MEETGFRWQNVPTIKPETFIANKEWCVAFLKTQSDIGVASMRKVNPRFQSKYADLLSIWTETIKSAANKNGLFVVQTTTTVTHTDYVCVDTYVTHAETGQCIHARTFIPVGTQGISAHAFASATTYARRISLAAFFGVVGDEDDDGNAAVDSAQQSQEATIGGDVLTIKEQNLLHQTAITNGYSVDDMKDILREVTGNPSFKTIPRDKYRQLYAIFKTPIGKDYDDGASQQTSKASSKTHKA